MIEPSSSHRAGATFCASAITVNEASIVEAEGGSAAALLIGRWLSSEAMAADAGELTNGLSMLIEVLILILTGLAIQKLSSFIIAKCFLRVKNPRLKIFLSHRVLSKALLLIVAIILYAFASSFQPPLVWLTRFTTCAVIIILWVLTNAMFHAPHDIL